MKGWEETRGSLNGGALNFDPWGLKTDFLRGKKGLGWGEVRSHRLIGHHFEILGLVFWYCSVKVFILFCLIKWIFFICCFLRDRQAHSAPQANLSRLALNCGRPRPSVSVTWLQDLQAWVAMPHKWILKNSVSYVNLVRVCVCFGQTPSLPGYSFSRSVWRFRGKSSYTLKAVRRDNSPLFYSASFIPRTLSPWLIGVWWDGAG